MVGHQSATPLDDTYTNAEHGKCGTQTEQPVLQSDEVHIGFVKRKLSYAEVPHEENEGTDDGQDEHERNLAFCAFGDARIFIRSTWPVRWQSGVFNSVFTRIITSALYGARCAGISVALLAHRSDSFT